MLKVALDAGHGMNTPGKRTPDDEREWSFNNKVVLAIIERLNDYQNVSVVRLDDPSGKTDVSLRDRTNKANREKADILVSVHHNANTGRWGSWGGTETYTFTNRVTQAERLARMVHAPMVKAYGLRDRGLKKANFHMLRESNMPAILTEGGFMDSTTDIEVLRNDSALKRAGKAIADGIAEYGSLTLKPVTKPSDGTLYRVQLGAFSNKNNADRLESELKRKGYDTYMVQADGLYKVQVGAFSNKSNADSLANKLKSDGYDVYVTTRSGQPASNSTSKPKTLKVGSKVKVNKGAKDFNGGSLASFVYNNTYDVIQINSNRVVIGKGNTVVAAVHKNNLTIV